MAARYSKRLLPLMLLGGVLAVSADERSSDAAREIARESMSDAVVELENAMSKCRDQRRVLGHEILEGINASAEHLLVALRYFHVKADNDCIRDEALDFLLAASLLEKSGATEDGGEKTEVSHLVLISYWQEVERRAEYLSLPNEVRVELEDVPALQEPFALVETAEQFGILD